MRNLGLSIVGVSLAALAFSCSSSGEDEADGAGGGSNVGVGGGSNPGTGGGTQPNTGGGANPNTGGGANPNTGGGANPNTGGSDNPNTGGGANPNTGGSDNPGAGGSDNPGAGGSDNPGAGGSGDPPPPKPSLVTSGEGAYWQVGEVTAGGSAATVTVDTAATDQTWHGFGGTFNEAGWAALSLLSDADQALAMRLLFDANDGIGFDWGRIPIGPSDYAIDRYTLSNAPGEFDITRDEGYLIPYIKEAQKVKGDVLYWASPWTPPPWAKTDEGCDQSSGAGCLKNGDYDKGRFETAVYQDYADFFVDWVEAYEAAGIPIHSVTPQNEPGWSQGYPTCSFGPGTDSTLNSTDVFTDADVSFGPFIENFLYPAMQGTVSKPGIWFGTMSNDKFFDTYWGSLTDKNLVIGVGLQWETINQLDGTEPWDANHIVMQSEHRCGNYPWKDAASSKETADRNTFWAAEAPNNHLYGEESWDLMKEWIDKGVQIYSAWNMVLDNGGFNLDEDRPWPQNALLVTRADGSLQVTAYYYVFRHIAQYTDVGAVRVGVTGNALAFKNPDGSVMTAIFNDGTAPASTTLSVDGTMVTFDIPARGWATVNM